MGRQHHRSFKRATREERCTKAADSIQTVRILNNRQLTADLAPTVLPLAFGPELALLRPRGCVDDPADDGRWVELIVGKGSGDDGKCYSRVEEGPEEVDCGKRLAGRVLGCRGRWKSATSADERADALSHAAPSVRS